MTSNEANDKTSEESPLARTAFRLYASQLHRFLARRLLRPQDVDDLAQEVFLRLVRLDKPELVRKPQAYLFRVAANLIREFRIRNDKEQERVAYDSEALDQIAEQGVEMVNDELAEQLNLARQLDRALAQLPRVQRAVLLMVKRDGLSHKEVARKTGIHVRTVERYVIEATAKMLTMEWDR
jgi:RNA polymerase sigma factor (sigma-70 family)